MCIILIFRAHLSHFNIFIGSGGSDGSSDVYACVAAWV